MNFSCPRSCRWAEARDFCRFMPVLAAVGPTAVTSHTAKIKVEFRDPSHLKAAVEALGGEWLGQGSARLYDGTSHHGLVFKLKGWRYPLIAERNGELAYDDYAGSWGNVADLERLKAEYSLGAAEQAAQLQGWLSERTEAGLVIHHPSSGTITIAAGGNVEFSGFVGGSCHSAREALGLPMADVQNKTEAAQSVASCQQQEGR